MFNMLHTPRDLDRNQSYTATFNHVLSPKTFYSVGGNFFQTEHKRGDGLFFDNLYSYYTATGGTDSTPSSNPRFDQDVPVFYDAGRVVPGYLQRKSSYIGFQTSLTSQVNAHNQVKFGGDIQRHTLRFFQHYAANEIGGQSPNTKDGNGYGYALNFDYAPYIFYNQTTGEFDTVQVVRGVHLDELNGGRDGAKHPKNFSVYAQDKYEREGVIVNGGLRYDYLNTDTQALLDPSLPLGAKGDSTNPSTTLDNQDLTKSKTYQRISPRLGIAFPLDERTILRFNYGQFYQQPNLQDLFTSYRFLEYKVKSGGYFVGFGNPNLRPERTTAYEIGLQRQFANNTAYYKDVKDLVEIQNIPHASTADTRNFSSYRNVDFATIKGVDIGLSLRPTNHLSGSLSYSLSFAQGTGSVSNSQRNIAWTVSQAPKQTAPLDFDQRHKLSVNLDWRLGKGEGPIAAGMHILENTGVNVLYNVSSGTPYTPTFVFDEVTLANVSSLPSGPVNSQYGPWTSTLDAKAERGFHVSGLDLSAFVWVLNIFNTRNPFQVFSSTGAANSTGFLDTSAGAGAAQAAHDKGKDYVGLYDLAQNDPSNYGNPRLVRFGLRTSF